MGLFGKAFRFKDRISQGLQGAKRFAGNAFNFVYNNSDAIGGALKAMSPYVGNINPAIGLAMQSGGTFLQNLKPGPVKEKLKKIAEDTSNGGSTSGNITMDSGAQQAVERRRLTDALKKSQKKGSTRTRKKAELTTQE